MSGLLLTCIQANLFGQKRIFGVLSLTLVIAIDFLIFFFEGTLLPEYTVCF